LGEYSFIGAQAPHARLRREGRCAGAADQVEAIRLSDSTVATPSTDERTRIETGAALEAFTIQTQ